MKKILSFAMCALLSSTMLAQTPTEDHFTISEAVVPLGDVSEDDLVYITVGLDATSSEKLYTAYNMDIVLPEGLDVYCDEDGAWAFADEDEGIYPFSKKGTKKVFTYSFGCNYGVVSEKILRVACVDVELNSFTDTKGSLFLIALKASSYCKPGVAEIKITGANLTDADGIKYVPADQTFTSVSVGNNPTIALNINAANKWSTCVLPFDLNLPAGVKAYACGRYDEQYAYLAEASSIQAYTPYIIYSENGYSGSHSGTVDESKYKSVVTSGYLSGAIMPQEVNKGYVLQNQGDGVKLHAMNGGSFAIPSGKCWFNLEDTKVKAMAFDVDDPDAINSIEKTADSQTIYDLQGRKVSTPEVGKIYIINSQKVLKLK